MYIAARSADITMLAIIQYATSFSDCTRECFISIYNFKNTTNIFKTQSISPPQDRTETPNSPVFTRLRNVLTQIIHRFCNRPTDLSTAPHYRPKMPIPSNRLQASDLSHYFVKNYRYKSDTLRIPSFLPYRQPVNSVNFPKVFHRFLTVLHNQSTVIQPERCRPC